MKFNNHNELEGLHAFLSASKYSWIHYSDDKLRLSYDNFKMSLRGTETHEFASLCIKRKQKLPKNHKTLNMFVNDAIGFGMNSEQVLYYSDNCFGTADAISFDDNVLRIHDLKTGVSPTHMEQLEIYAALFCIEYGHNPDNIDIVLRIYQSDEIIEHVPEVEDIKVIIDKIVRFDKLINDMKNKE